LKWVFEMVKVKICGLTNYEDAVAAKNLGADFLGFVIEVPNAARSLDKEEAKELFEDLQGKTTLVALTPLTNARETEKICRFLEADAVQLLKPVQTKEIVKLHRQMPGTKIMATVQAKDEKSAERALLLQRFADFLVLDAASGKQLGGTGKKADQEISKRIVQESRIPVFLAGGLNPENVSEAVKKVRPFGVDVSSGVKLENNKRKVDFEKLKKFIKEAKK